jgi:crotonobetainyl-CoA:carnitine CoA-transferase CaiB-like acyl-CoA transferase
MANRALEGIRVVELASFVAGPYAAKLLGHMGADVIKVEPPGGDIARRMGPFKGDDPHSEKSGLFFYLNAEKRGVTLDLRHSQGMALFHQLLKEADVLIEDSSPEVRRELGLGYDDLKAVNHRLVVTSITPFGLSGPYKDYKAYYLNTFHSGGEGYCTPGSLGWILYSDRPPIKTAGFLGEHDVGVCAANATMGALHFAEVNGVGQQVEVSKQEALANIIRYDLAVHNLGYNESRASRMFPIGGLIQCQNGFVMVMPIERHMWDGVLDLMGDPEWLRDEKYDYDRIARSVMLTEEDVRRGMKDREDVNSFLQEWALEHTKEEIFHSLQERHCLCGMVFDAHDLVNSAQVQHRGYFVEIEHPVVGRVKMPGAPFKHSGTPWAVERPAPLLGQHNEDILLGQLGHSREELVRWRQAGVI